MPPQTDQLAPEDVQDLIEAQQHLYASQDPRAEKLYNYLIQNRYAQADQQGALRPMPTMEAQPSWTDQLKSTFTHPLNSLDAASQMRQTPRDASLSEMMETDASNTIAGAGSVIRHPLRTVSNAFTSGFGLRPIVENTENAIISGAGGTPQRPDQPILPQNSDEASYALGQAVATGGLIKNLPTAARAIPTVVDAMAATADVPEVPVTKTIPNQNYAPSHAAAFEGALAPAASMGKNFAPQEVTPQALTPIRATAARMMQGNPMDQATARLATDPSTPPLARIQAYQSVVQNSLRDLESLHSSALASAADVPVDTSSLIEGLRSHISATTDPADAAAINGLIQRVRQVRTIDDLNTFRQELNNETSPEYKQSQIQAGRSGTSVQAASDLAGNVRNAYYDNLGEATGVDYTPLKRRESNLLTTLEALQNQQSTLARAEATFNAPSTLKEKVGNVADVIRNPKTTVTQTILRESPATRVSTLLQKSLADLPTAPSAAPQLGRGAIIMPPPSAPVGGPSMPPPVAATTRAQRLGLLLKAPPIELPGAVQQNIPAYSADTAAARMGRLLPQTSNGPTVLPNPFPDAMSSGENVAALMQALRRGHALQLPQRAQPFQLPSTYEDLMSLRKGPQ